MTHDSFKVAAVQAAPFYLDLEASTDKAITLIEEAAAQGVQLIAFPETWLPGYPWWIWLGAPIGSGRFFLRYFDNAPVAGGEQDRRLAEAAREYGIQVVMGLAERDGDKLYMAQWHYDAEGRVISRRRKLRPTHEERAVFGEGDKQDLRVIDTDLGRVGALCCCEHLQPMLKCAMTSQAEQVHIAAWPGFSLYNDQAFGFGAELNLAASRTYAAECQAFVVLACGIVTPAMHEMLCPDDARIYGPDGASLGAELAPDTEGLVIAEISVASIAQAKSAANPMAYFDRSDLDRFLHTSHARSA